MKEGQGFSVRVDLSNLHKFSPLLKPKAAEGTSAGENEDNAAAGSDDTANESNSEDPALAEVENLFRGVPLRTGVKMRRTLKKKSSVPEAGETSPLKALDTIHTTQGEVLLVRVRPRRTGTQFQVSLAVHGPSGFMRDAKEVAASDGSRRPVGFNRARKKINTARFEAPEMDGIKNPVARFHWAHSSDSSPVLRYEIFDGDVDAEGIRIFRKLRAAITKPPLLDFKKIGRSVAVLSSREIDSAQWYMLEQTKS